MSSKNPVVFLMSKLWKYSKDNRRQMVIYITFSTIAHIIRVFDIILVGFVMNIIQKEGISNVNIHKIILLLSLFVLAEIAFWIFHGPSRVMEYVNAFIARRNYKLELLKGVMNLPLDWHTDRHSGDTIDKIEKGTRSLFDFGSWTFKTTSAITTFIVSLIALIRFNLLIGIISFVLSLIIFKIIFFFDKRLIPGYKFVNQNENIVSEKVYDGLSNITTLVILKIQNSIVGVIETTINKSFYRFKQNHKINEFKWFLVGLFGRLIVFASVVIFIMVNYHKSAILVGSIYMVYNFSDSLRRTFQDMAYLYSQMVINQTSVNNSEELADYFIDHIPNTDSVQNDWQKLYVENLSFSYHNNDSNYLHIDDISFSVEKGQRIAIIGESGGGKSTLLKLMRDLYHPKSVNVSIDNNTVNGFIGISNSISLIPQDPEIFATTIRENITMGIDYTDEYIKKFTDIGCFTDVIDQLPKGLDSSLVEKGVNLSGGQKQRLALVRGLIASHDKEIVLLDEPTSSVDMVNEINIYKNIFQEFKNKTIISSIHKLYLLPMFDIIFYLDNGKIIAKGNYETLKDTSEQFRELLKKQENLKS